jgi:hypothetical protein
MKNPYDLSGAMGELDKSRIAALSGGGWEANKVAALSAVALDAGQMATLSDLASRSYGQFAFKEIQRQQEAFERLHGGQLAWQMEQAIHKIHGQEMEMASIIERQMKSLIPSYEHLNTLTSITDPPAARYAQDLADQSARVQQFYAEAFGGFEQIQKALTQPDISNAIVPQLDAGAKLRNLVGVSALIGQSLDGGVFADSITKHLKMFGWGEYEDQVRSLLGGIDFDALQRMATTAGVAFEQELDEDEVDDQRPPSAARIQSAIEQANLGAVRQAVDTMFAEAIRRTAQKKTGKKISETLLLFVLLPLLYTLINTFGSPLFARWLAQRDAEEAQAKTSPAAQQTLPQSRFADSVVVKAESLPIRRGPSTTERTLMVATRGQLLQVLRRKGRWARVRYVDALHDGVSITGWVKLKQTQRVEDETVRMIWCAMLETPIGCERRDAE